jgi:hypothetical protein
MNGGPLVVPVDKRCAGMYVFKFSENASAQATVALVIRYSFFRPHNIDKRCEVGAVGAVREYILKRP